MGGQKHLTPSNFSRGKASLEQGKVPKANGLGNLQMAYLQDQSRHAVKSRDRLGGVFSE